MQRVRRRQFLGVAGALLAAPWGRAQSQTRTYRLGILQAGNREGAIKLSEEPFLGALAALGFAEGRNLVIERRYADSQLERLPGLAKELVALKPDLIFSPASQPTAALKALGTSIPVVFCFVSDPVASGFARTLARPGGSFTGLSNFGFEIAAKRVELLKEIVPKLRRLCAWNNPDSVVDAGELEEVKRAADRFGMEFRTFRARNPAEFEEAAAATRAWAAGGIYVTGNPTSYVHRRQIVALAAALKTPAIYWNIAFVEEGGLIAYAADFHDLARRAAVFADKILRCANPAELPIEQPTVLNLVVNLKAARAIGVTLSQAMVQRADRVIE